MFYPPPQIFNPSLLVWHGGRQGNKRAGAGYRKTPGAAMKGGRPQWGGTGFILRGERGGARQKKLAHDKFCAF